MKEKFKSFFKGIALLLLALAIQFVTYLIVAMVGTIIILVSSHGSIKANDVEILTQKTTSLTPYSLIISSIITVIVLMLIFNRKNRDFKEELNVSKTKNINYFIAIMIGTGFSLFNGSVLILAKNSGLFVKYFSKTEKMLSPLVSSNIILTILTIVIVAPIAEEFIFRGAIFRTLSKKISIKWTIFIQALLFAIYHGNLIQGINTIFMGLFLGYVIYKTKSIFVTITIHATNNLLAVFLPNINGIFIEILLMVLGFTGILISILMIKKHNDINATESDINIIA